MVMLIRGHTLLRLRISRLLPLGIILALGVVGLAGYAFAAGFTVTLTQGGPQPGSFTAALGDTVTFVNNDYLTHTVVDRSVGMVSPPLGPGQSFAYVLTTSGRHTYSQEGKPTGAGQIVVQRTGTVTLKTSRHFVAYGSGAVLSGTTSLPSFPVKIEQKGKSDVRWNDAGTITPALDGSFVLGIKPQIGAAYRANVFDGELLSSLVEVDVRPVVRLTARRRSVPGGSLVTLTARIVPADAANSVELMRFDTARQDWRRVTSRDVSGGIVTFQWRVDFGPTLLRVSVVKHGLVRGFAETSSRSVVVTGTGTPPPTQRKHRRHR
jgi:hypothetical protein